MTNQYMEIKIKELDDRVKALEQEPEGRMTREPSGDAISRQAVLSMQYRIDDSATLSMRDVVNVDDIEDLPPVTPQPKTGYWILLDECSNSGYYCSECLKKVVKEGWSDTVKKIKYCPNCGAKMVEPQESEG